MRKRSASGNRYEYHLTPSGKALAPVLTEMGKWGMRWSADCMTEKQNTAAGLARDLAGALNIDELPSCDTVIRIDLTDVKESPTRHIHVRDGQAQVCDTDLGFEVDVYLTSTLKTMTRIWYGELDVRTAVRDGLVEVKGAPVYSRTIGRWLGISSFTTDNPKFEPA
jgi:putative sterol carrier protein